MLFRLFILGFLFLGCSVKEPTEQIQNQRILTLMLMLMALDTDVEREEAYHLAAYSIKYSQSLADRYELVSSPWIHNTLVNVGIKERGLCHEWTEDLLRALLQQAYHNFDFHAVGANIGTWSEHNALVVSAKGKPYGTGILLDAWRDSGRLYFIKVGNDSKYRWFERKGLYGEFKQ